jgi:type IX secretion system PorP/SprF family membrane protein
MQLNKMRLLMNQVNLKQMLIGVCFIGSSFTGMAQQKFENAMSQYFHNRSLLNPAFTGMDGNKIQAIQNRSWIGFDGAPVLTVFTGEFNFGLNSSGGAHIFSDKSGIVFRTTGILNYSYNIKLNQNQQLKLGIAFTISSERLDNSMIDATTAIDPLIAANINGKPSYDGNFGALYIADKLTIGTSFFRIGENLSKNALGNADLILMKGGIYYHFNKDQSDKVQIRPMAMISIFRNLPAVFDGGVQAIFSKHLNAMVIYQSTGNIRTGAGLVLGNIGEANVYYNSNLNRAGINAQQYELGLKFNIGNKK